jgi:hypothetical protein
MENNYTVMNHEYTNTGGNCMVSVFTVYDHSAKSVRYVACDDERLNFMTFDVVHNETPADLDYDEFILESCSYDLLVSDPGYDNPVATLSEEKFLLFKNCQFEHYKKDCKYFGIRIQLSIEELPGELYNELGMDAIEWHKENGDMVYTDGYRVWPSDGYEPNEYSRSILDFKQFIDDIAGSEHKERYYDKKFTIVFNGRALELDFAADEYDVISDALRQIVDRLN